MVSSYPSDPFFNKHILLAPLRLESFTITFFVPLLDFVQWQSSTLTGSTSRPAFQKSQAVSLPDPCFQ